MSSSASPASQAVMKRPASSETGLTPSASSSTALTATASSSTALMPPPPPPKRIKRPATVVDEDTYTDALSRIIARDFFPGLAESAAQQEYLDAQAGDDPAWLASAGRHLAEVMTPGPQGRARRGTSLATPLYAGPVGETPRGWTGDTPLAEEQEVEGQGKEAKVDMNLSLGGFQAKYTSEDNESFNQLLDKQNERRREKHAWMWAGNQLPSARQRAHRERQGLLEAKRDEQEKEDGKKQLTLQAADARQAMPDTWKSRPDNNFMFGPDSVEDELETRQQKAEANSRAGPKAVVHDNTRFPLYPAAEVSAFGTVPESPSLSAVDAAIARRPRLSASEVDDFAGGETPRVNGYAFVDSEPSPEPEPAPSTDWSNIPLGPGDATPNPFTIKERSQREDLHHRMVDKVAKSKRTTQLAAQSKTPVPKFASSPRPGKAALTPAGQRLLGNVGGTTPGESIWEGPQKGKSSLGANWTPRVKPSKKAT